LAVFQGDFRLHYTYCIMLTISIHCTSHLPSKFDAFPYNRAYVSNPTTD
jgi:hypothetical protein